MKNLWKLMLGVIALLSEIISHIGPTAQIVERITPVYNFKAAE